MHVAILGTYPPTRCGIATFTADVEASLRLNDTDVSVIAVADLADAADADGTAVARDDPESYAAAARRLNSSGCDVVLIQHEFGIFGGEAGEHVLRFTENLAMPYVVTLHTVLPRFSTAQLRVMRSLCGNAATVTVFTGSARRLILDQDIVPARFLKIVAHGAPSELYQEIDVAAARKRLGLPAGGPVMSTFGLLSQGKGIELAIQAMALLNGEHPDLRYVVAGRTHPEIVRREGERYRHCLRALADDLGVGERVIFVDRFLELDELADLLGVSDVVCTPYRGGDQTVSGVLTFALAAGCPIVSTPYRYARDVLADGAGLLVDFDDEEGFADALHTLLDQQAGARARAAARAASESMEWYKVGDALRSVLAAAVRRPLVELTSPSRLAARPEERAERRPRPSRVWLETRRNDGQRSDAPVELSDTLVQPGTSHLRLLCDDTAVLQHAHHNVPRTEDGYCVDDAGRVLSIIDRLAISTGDECWYVAVGRVLAFLRAAAGGNDGGRMRNFMAWDRRWMDEPYVGDHVGRAIWGLGELMAANGPFAEQACELMDTLAPAVSPDWPARTVAYAGLGLVAAAGADPSRAEDLDRIVPLFHEWRAPDDPAWDWSEDRLTYDNARVPEVLLRAGHFLNDGELVRHGATMLHWLETVCRQGRHYRFPGCRGLTDAKGLSWSGDEQPLEAAAMADAHAAWYQVSGDPASLAAIERAWSWFLGNNRLGEPLVDIESGGGFDGLGTRSVNRNRGAESTIAAHRCAMTYAASMTAAPPRNGITQISVHA